MFFQEGYPGDRLNIAALSASPSAPFYESGRVGVIVDGSEKMPASIGGRAGVLPEVLADVTDPFEDRELSMKALLARGLREVRDSRHIGDPK